MFVGSISHSPALPFGAAAVTVPCTLRLWPDVSTKPPSPFKAPASMRAPASTCVKFAKATPSCNSFSASVPVSLCRLSPPSTTWPPAVSPVVLIEALPNMPTRSPESTTVPPLAPAAVFDASMVPVIVTSPVLPASATTVPARTTPDRFTTVLSSVSLPRAVSSTAPSCAWMLPLFSTSALAVALVSTSEMPWPLGSATVALSPAARMTRPPMAVLMSPLLRTWSPIRVT